MRKNPPFLQGAPKRNVAHVFTHTTHSSVLPPDQTETMAARPATKGLRASGPPWPRSFWPSGRVPGEEECAGRGSLV